MSIRYRFDLEGTTSLLMHGDDVEQGDALKAWRDDPTNQSVSVAGDDRSPAWTWITYLYHDGKHLVIPAENLMKALCYGGANIPLRGAKTFKSLSQSGLMILSDNCEFRIGGGRQVKVSDVEKLRAMPFSHMSQAVKSLGFDLFVKRAKMPNGNKHVRVRARFSEWSVSGELVVNDAALTPEVLSKLFEIAGHKSGLGDWRASAPKSPGNHGLFNARLKRLA